MTLFDQLTSELSVTRPQAEGGVGLLLRQAQSRLSADEFLRVADAIPAISDLMGKAPRPIGLGIGPAREVWLRWFSGWGRLAPLRSDCEGLGLDHAAISKFVTVIGAYFRQQSDAEVESLLLRAWQ